MFRKTSLMAAAPVALALAFAPPASAQQQQRPTLPSSGYREGMPAVNTPPPPVNPNAGNNVTAASFSAWYARNGRPSMLLFWNRQLIEDGTSQYDNVATQVAVGESDSGAFAARGRGVAIAGSSSTAAVASEQRTFQERSTDSRYTFADGVYAKAVESAIMGTLLSAGARVVDREAMIRKLGASKSRDERMDIQHLETLALGQGVQYLIEVLPDNNLASPTGVSFTVKVTHLPTSTIRAQFVTTGDPPRGPSKLVAVNGAGFERRDAPSRRTPQLIGAQVAYETMAKLK
jgi:hypothetical protein